MRRHGALVAASVLAVGIGGPLSCTILLGTDKDYQDTSGASGSPSSSGASGSSAAGGGQSTSGSGGPLCIKGATQSCYTGTSGTEGTGVCKAGTQTCANGQWGPCQGETTPSVQENCNGEDDNCDGQTDEGNPGGGQPCDTGKPGVCSAGTTACQNGSSVCNQNMQPSKEICDGLDNNCNGAVDDGTSGAGCNTGLPGICAAGIQSCFDGQLVCDSINEPMKEIECNGVDDDCDGQIDEECFAAGTTVTMADGSARPIEQVHIGDWVLGYDLKRARVMAAPVVRTFIHPLHKGSTPLVRINNGLRATVNHPFYANGRWVRADQLAPGDSLLVLDGSGDETRQIQSVAVSLLLADAERETTYNIEVEGVHDYFAGGVLVHNKMICP